MERLGGAMDEVSVRITSSANPRIKAAARLREHRERRARQLTLVDGLREIERALACPHLLQEVYFDPEGCTAPAPAAVLQRLRAAEIPCTEVAANVLEKLAFGERNEGLVAVAQIPSTSLDAWTEPRELVLVLEAVEKPGNVGAVLRTADAVGAALILADARTDLFNPNAIRASLGAVFHVPACEVTSRQALDWLRHHNYRLIAARVDGTNDHWSQDLRGRVALVLGSEATGLSTAWDSADIVPVRLPMRGQGDSLNVSVTAAVLAYEALRQREPPPA